MTSLGSAKRRSQFLQENGQLRILLPIRFDHRTQPAQFHNCSLKLLLVDGLQQVIDRVRLKCAQGVLVVCSSEDDERLAREFCQQLEAIHGGHLDIEKEDVDL